MRTSIRHRLRSGAAVASLVAVSLLVAACALGGNGLTGKTWELTAITEKVPAFQGVVPADQQANYTISFSGEGQVQIKADCNSVAGTYTTTDSGDIEIMLGPSTLVACPEGSMADQYLAGLAAADSYKVDGNSMTLTLKDEGTLEFTAAA